MSHSSKQRYQAFLDVRQTGREDVERGDGRSPAASQADGRRWRYARRYYRWLLPFRPALIGIFCLAVVATGFSLVLPLATRYAVDEILLGSRRVDALRVFGGGMVAVILVWQSIEIGRQWWMAVHAGVRIFGSDRERLERLARYVARPAFAQAMAGFGGQSPRSPRSASNSPTTAP